MSTEGNAQRTRVALIIGAGGLKCAAALGVWKVLRREGIAIDFTAGCSGGGLFASMIALGYQPEEVEALLYKIWTKENLSRYHYRSFLQLLLPRVFGFDETFGLLDDGPFMAPLIALFGDRTFADTRIPLFLIAADLERKEKVVLCEGRILDAMRASIAIPIIFRPWKVDGRWLVDGGLYDPLPVDVAIREGIEVIIAMGFEETVSVRAGSLLSLFFQIIGTFENNLLKSSYAFHNLTHYAEIMPIIQSFDRPIGLTDTHLLPYIIAEGERSAEELLPYLRRLLEESSKPRVNNPNES
jgi:NTE family protein